MASGNNALLNRLRSTVGIRFIRFAGVALASLATSQVTLGVCDSVFHLPATPTAILSWFTGAVVSYVLSRRAWERRGRPDVLRETVPFWIISAVVVVVLTLSTNFGYDAAARLHLHGIRHVAFVGGVYLAANCLTFLARFAIFHYVLFADPGAAAVGPDAETCQDAQEVSVGLGERLVR